MSDYIPFSVQAEIIKRLPTKSLLQFRTLSKTWKSLIDSSKFVIDHAVNHNHQQHLLLCYRSQADPGKQKVVSIVDDETFPEQKCSLPDPIAGLGLPTVLGSSRGLFCLFCRGGDPDEPGRIRHTALLWNPSIRKSIVIDVPYELTCPCTNIAIGFGVCPCTIDPKIVKIIYRYVSSNLGALVFSPWEVEVYTLSSRAWKSIPTINQPRNSIHFTGNEVVTDGFMYWLVVDCSLQEYNMIVSFDIAREEFKEVSLPDTLARANKDNMVISKLMESLVVVEMVQEVNKKVYDVWMMEHGVPNSFTKLYTINSPDASIEAVLGFRRNNEPIFSMRDDAGVRRRVYDADYFFVREHHTEHLSYVGISGNSDSRSANSYMETLLLLDQ
ncbi:F-box protein CPR1-like [Bidens hawaiensis]|uniref:F-box protein CPR1-like n=1 Tax=Bidens hawaiensis TaxID=980011 RepID=UPI00404BA0B1